MATLLSAHDIDVYYGDKQVVHGASVAIGSGEIVALIGHNGAGKSTLLKALFGVLPLRNGIVSIDGNVVTEVNPAPDQEGHCLSSTRQPGLYRLDGRREHRASLHDE